MSGVLRVAVQWTDDEGTTNTLSDWSKINLRKGDDIKHNTADISLQNAIGADKVYIVDDTIRFTPEQQLDIYAVWDDGSGVTVTDSSNLVFSGRVVEFSGESTADKTGLKLKCSDSSYIALNKLWVGDEADTPPNLIISVVGFINDTIDDPTKQITAALTTGGGLVQATDSTGAAFSTVQLSKVFKPAYEVIQDLSQPDYTNESSEIPYRFHIDKNNELKWFYPDDSAQHVVVEGALTAQSANYVHPISGDSESVTDTNSHIVKNVKLKRAVYDVVNFIIYKAGEDMDNVQILDFKFDETSGAPTLKESFRNWEEIARDMKKEDANAGNITKTTGDIYGYPAGYPVTPAWDRDAQSVANDSEYNANFIVEAKKRANARCAATFKKTGSPRWKGTVEVEGNNIYDANDPIIFTSARLGIDKVFMRVTDVQHNISKGGWFVTLTVEEEIPKES